MSSRVRTVAGASLVAVLAFGACTVKDHPDEPTATAGNGTAGSEGGRSGSSTTHAGSSSKAGRGGTNATGGTSTKGGTGGAGGTGNMAGASATGGEAGAGGAPICPGCDSGFCLEDGTCVDCLASNDQCPARQYCTEAHECVEGCKADGRGCASGACDENHNCSNCINDDECKDGLVCGNGTCSAACTEAEEGQTAACGNGLTCCSLHCTDVAVSSDHCGACGSDCNAGEFCGIDACADGGGGADGASAAPCVACHPTTLANICSIAQAVVILDGSDGNRAPGRAIGEALKAKCSPSPVLSEAEQDSAEALNFTTGRPVSGGRELLVVAGGPFYQNLEGYVEKQRIAPLYWFVNGDATEFRKSADDSPVVSLPIAGDHDSHDLFIIQFMRDAASGSLVLNAQGFWLSGTIAAAFQLQEGLLPTLSTFDKAWYVYEWTDMNGDKLPDLNEMSLQASGP